MRPACAALLVGDEPGGEQRQCLLLLARSRVEHQTVGAEPRLRRSGRSRGQGYDGERVAERLAQVGGGPRPVDEVGELALLVAVQEHAVVEGDEVALGLIHFV